MQAVILAAGEGTRMRPLTHHVPKPLVRFSGKNLIEHNLDILPKEITELIFVVGYLKEQIINHFGDEFQGRKVTYVVQKKPLGTAHALSLVQKHIKGRFLVMMGDDLYSKVDIQACLSAPESAILVQKIRSKFNGGNVQLDVHNHLIDISEGVHNSGYINAALYVITPDYFTYDMVPIKEGKEFGLPQTLVLLARDHPVKVIKAQWWKQITDMIDIKHAPVLLKTRV